MNISRDTAHVKLMSNTSDTNKNSNGSTTSRKTHRANPYSGSRVVACERRIQGPKQDPMHQLLTARSRDTLRRQYINRAVLRQPVLMITACILGCYSVTDTYRRFDVTSKKTPPVRTSKARHLFLYRQVWSVRCGVGAVARGRRVEWTA